jgi:hypothetical protein
MSKQYVDITATFTVEAVDCKEAIEQVEAGLGEHDALAVDWPTIEQAKRTDTDW